DSYFIVCFFFQAEDGIRDYKVTGVQTCALPIFQHFWPNETRRARDSGWTEHARPARIRKTRRHSLAQDRRRLAGCRRSESLADPARASAQRIFSRHRRIHHALRPNEGTRKTS